MFLLSAAKPSDAVIMDSKILFGDSNSGSQIGINYGSITNEFSLPLSKLRAILFRVDSY